MLSLDEIKKIIVAQPIFGLLTATDIASLAELFKAKTIDAEQAILVVGETIKNIYLTVEGQAEISHKIPIGILHAGDVIGISDEGFFSQEGRATANFIALTTMLVLEIPIDEFKHFMQEPAHLYPGLKFHNEKIVRMNFIKNALPFAHLDMAEVAAIVPHIKVEEVKAGTRIFQQGDMGNKIYFVREGKVQVERGDTNGKMEIVAVLQAPEIFGEAAFVTAAPRNAGVMAIADCHLLSLDYKFLNQLVKQDPLIKEQLGQLTYDRTIPAKSREAIVFAYQKAGEEAVILKDQRAHKYCRLPAIGEYVWQELDGRKTVAQLISLANQKTGQNMTAQVKTALTNLLNEDFISLPGTKKTEVPLSWWQRLRRKLGF